MEVSNLVSHLDLEGLDFPSLDDLSVRQSERIGRFTASEDHKLMTGVDYTQEQRINAIKNQFKLKQDLIDFVIAFEQNHKVGIRLNDKNTMVEIAAKIEPYIPIGLSDGGITHVRNKVIEELTGKPIMDFESFDMHRGKELEAATIEHIETKYNCKITQCLDEQIFHQETRNEKLQGHIGCTPDGYIEKLNLGFEGKAPKAETHFKYLFGDGNKPALSADTLKELEPRYYWQIVKCLYMNPTWDGYVFTSFNPDYKEESLKDITFIVSRSRVKEDIPKLNRRLEMAVKLKQEILAKSTQHNSAHHLKQQLETLKTP